MNIDKAFPSTYIKASDLDGRSVNVTIREVKVEQIGRDRESKPVLYFEGKQKGFVLNKTNARKIASIAGSGDTDDWTGVQIAIFPTETEFSGDMVECIRVKAPGHARRAAPVQEEAFDSDIEAASTAKPTPASRPASAPATARPAVAAPTITADDIPF